MNKKNIKKLFKPFSLIRKAFVILVTVILLIIVGVLYGVLLNSPGSWLNAENYREVLIFEVILLAILPILLLVLIAFLLTNAIGNTKTFSYEFSRIMHNVGLIGVAGETGKKKFIRILIVGSLLFLYFFFGIGRLLQARNAPPVILKTQDCYTYYSYTYGRRRTQYYRIVIQNHVYDSNERAFAKLTEGLDVKEDVQYVCKGATLVILPAIDTVIDVK